MRGSMGWVGGTLPKHVEGGREREREREREGERGKERGAYPVEDVKVK